MVLSCISSEITRDFVRKSWFFHTTLVFDAPVRESPSDYCLPVWFRKTKWLVYPMVKKSMTICLPALTECTNVTDRRTDRQTHTQTPHHGKGRAWCKHRAAKIAAAYQRLVSTTCHGLSQLRVSHLSVEPFTGLVRQRSVWHLINKQAWSQISSSSVW